MPPLTSFTAPLTAAQADLLRDRLPAWGFSPVDKPHTLYAAEQPAAKVNVAIYAKGPKVLIQGKGTPDFIQFHLEPEILGEARLGYEEELSPETYSPHFGIDESGKGDFFGPLVIAGCYVDGDIARRFREAGVTDSKRIGSDAKIRLLADLIRHTPGAAHNVVVVGPAAYNRLYAKMGNLNRLLAWGHARVIENLLAARPDCPRALSDQFGNPALIQRALLEKGRTLQLDQRTKAESDPAVAAASILARERFIDALRDGGERHGLGAPFPRGVSADVKAAGRRLAAAHGGEILQEIAKTHFRTAHEISPEQYAEPVAKPVWRRS